MDTSSAIISGLLAAAIIVPILIVSAKGKRKYRDIAQKLRSLASACGAEITESEIMYKSAIGLDPERKWLFFFEYDMPQNAFSLDLSKFKSCVALKSTHTVQDGKDSRTIIDRLALQMIHRSPEVPPVELTFYDSAKSLQLNDELPLLEERAQRINGLLR